MLHLFTKVMVGSGPAGARLARPGWRIVFVLTALICFPPAGGADERDSFLVEDIRLEGLQRISIGSAFNALPLRVGDEMTPERTTEVIRALFSTGFFSDIELDREGDVVVIRVVERPSVASIEITGNEDIPSEELLKGLKEIGLAEGRVFVPSALDAVEQELQRQYFGHGKYGVTLRSEVEELPRNRVAIDIIIEEGDVARIRQINLVGNEVFADRELLAKFELSTPNLLTFITGNDKYSKEKLSGDLESLRSFYLDRGYLDFNIESTQVAITPNKAQMYITINVTEGNRYEVEEVRLSGELIVDSAELVNLVLLRPGDVFSRRQLNWTTDAISERLGREGYAFSNVNAIPDVDEERGLVSLTFFIDPGKRVYVRRVGFAGNDKTRDEVLRREMRQMEGAWFSSSSVERSRVRLERLGFFEEVNVETPAVAGSADEVDVEFSVTERPSGTISAGFGFAQGSGILLNGSVTQDNFLGTGKRVAVTLSDSDYSRVYSVSQTDPYYTIDGISRTLAVFFRTTDAAEENLTEFDTDSIGANIGFNVPINEFDSIGLGIGVENTQIGTNIFTPIEITSFISDQGDDYNIIRGNASWSHDTRNRAIFPTAGGLQSISGELALPVADLEFYKIFYNQQRYFPIGRSSSLMFAGTLGYGDGYGDTDELPFFEHFFAGGFNSVRGFKSNTLGPLTAFDRDPFGGDTLIIGKAEFFFPPPLIDDVSSNFRMSTFFDIGNVFGGDENVDVAELRYSVGVGAIWISPFGPLSVSMAIPFNDDEDDETEGFQFNLGANF